MSGGAAGAGRASSRGAEAAAARARRPMSDEECAAVPGRPSGRGELRTGARSGPAGGRAGARSVPLRGDAAPSAATGPRSVPAVPARSSGGRARSSRRAACVAASSTRLRLEVHHHPEGRARRLRGVEPVEHVFEHLLRRTVERVPVAAAARAVEGHHVAGLDPQCPKTSRACPARLPAARRCRSGAVRPRRPSPRRPPTGCPRAGPPRG